MHVYLFHSTGLIKHYEWLLHFNPRNETLITKQDGQRTDISKNAWQERNTNSIVQRSARQRTALTAAATSPAHKSDIPKWRH
jgi:hypothetical protein